MGLLEDFHQRHHDIAALPREDKTRRLRQLRPRFRRVERGKRMRSPQMMPAGLPP